LIFEIIKFLFKYYLELSFTVFGSVNRIIIDKLDKSFYK